MTRCLVEACWDDPPATADSLVRRQIMNLRRRFEGIGLATRGGGYSLSLDAAEVDHCLFESKLHEGRTKLMRGLAEDAEEEISSALDLWNGPAYANVRGVYELEAERARLAELKSIATMSLAEAMMAQQRHRDAVTLLSRAVEAHPLREDLWEQLMVALYLSGRRAEATRAFHVMRHRLIDEVGVKPGAKIQLLHSMVLSDDSQGVRWVLSPSGRRDATPP
ncbi:AfsR/SARP family transcriptional regulator [Streptosporangium sandarakinum]|nr:AfsR/SARP family transcriptional regulator [Streptosporangium sandarakinum]